MFVFARWLGSPVASLSYSLWNIRISGHASLMVDMAVPYRQLPGPDTDFAEIRDSFYLLTIMNQFTMKAQESMKREAEGLLRIMLFSKDLRLQSEGKSLRSMRQQLAQDLRENRRGGAVPAFIGQVSKKSVVKFALTNHRSFGLCLPWRAPSNKHSERLETMPLLIIFHLVLF
jgi:hypothetical protein